MFIRPFICTLVFGAAAFASPTGEVEDQKCAPRDVLAERLGTRFSERQIGGGLQDADTLIEIWSSKETGSFSLMVTRADGISCLVSTGWNWTELVPGPDASGLAG